MSMFKSFSIAAISLFISGCGSKIPACGDQDALKTLNEIIIKESNSDIEDSDISKYLNDKFKLTFDTVIMNDENEKTKKKSCKNEAVFRFDDSLVSHLKEMDNSPELAEFIGLRWRLITGALSTAEYGSLDDLKAHPKISNDSELVELINMRSQRFEKLVGPAGVAEAKVASVPILAMSMNKKILPQFDENKDNMLGIFNQTINEAIKTKGIIKFPVEYSIEKVEDKKTPFQISAKWEDAYPTGIQLVLMWEVAYQKQKQIVKSK